MAKSHVEQAQVADAVSPAGGRHVGTDGTTDNSGGFRLTIAIPMYDTDGGIKQKIGEQQQPRRYFKEKRNALSAAADYPHLAVCDIGWVSDYAGPFEDVP
jgi:hypothetical protein